MRAFLNDGSGPENEECDTHHRWGRREIDYAARGARRSDAQTHTLTERIAARVGFASFERACVAVTTAIVLAGCAIMFHAAFDKRGAIGEAAIEPTIIVARREKPVEEQPPAPAPIAPAVSIFSQTPIRESAREALARATPRETVRAAPSSEAATPPDEALSYADATTTEPGKAPDDAGHLANCLVKVGSRMLNRGACKVSHRGVAVTFAYGGSTVTIAPHRGREWTLSVDGRRIGKVYKNGADCWGSRNHTRICEKGA